jgi:hypothetical protein
MPIHGLAHWKKQAGSIAASTEIEGLEKAVVFLIHLFHLMTVSGWIKIVLDSTAERPTRADRYIRNRAIELFILLEVIVICVIIFIPQHVESYQVLIATFILFEILLNLSSVIFVGKLHNVYPPTASIERSLILFAVNILQVILIFGIFYRASLGLSFEQAVFASITVFGTLGHPSLRVDFTGAGIVEFQVVVDFALIAIFLAAYVGKLGAYRRMDDDDTR